MRIAIRRKVAAMTCAASLLAFGAACGGSGEASEAAVSPTPSPQQSAAAAELRTLVAQADRRTFQATYDATIEGDELSGSGTLLLAQADGREVTRLSLSEAEGIPFREIVLVAGGEKTTACFGDGDRGTCLKASGDVGDTFRNPLDLTALLERVTGDGEVTRVDDEAPGGIPSRCYKSSSDGQDGIACFATESGIPTRLDATSDGSRVKLAVTSIADDVDGDVFETPRDYVTLGR